MSTEGNFSSFEWFSPAMSILEQTGHEEPLEVHPQEIHQNLRKLERRDWWLWIMAILVMLLLTVAVISLNFPQLLRIEDPFLQYGINQAVRGLVALVLLFNAYTVYQQVMIKRLRLQLATQLDAVTRLHARAQEFHRQATVDPLTGLYNRRLAEQRLAAEAARSQRYGHPLTVLALDLNDFKQINDRYGHLAGDLVLRGFSERLNSAIRVSDAAARMGGDEFLVLLPECPPGHVQTILARLRPLEIEYKGQKIPVSFSAGWVGYEQGETPQQFLERADKTLYADKRAGKEPTSQLSRPTESTGTVNKN